MHVDTFKHSNKSAIPPAPISVSPSSLLPMCHETAFSHHEQPAAQLQSTAIIRFFLRHFLLCFCQVVQRAKVPSELEAVCKAKKKISVTRLLLSQGLFAPCFLFYSRGGKGRHRERLLTPSWTRARYVLGGIFPPFLISEGEVCTDRCWVGSFSGGGSLSLNAGAWMKQAWLSGLGCSTSQGEGQTVQKMEGEKSLQDLYSHFQTQRRVAEPGHQTLSYQTHESHNSLSGCQSIRECADFQEGPTRAQGGSKSRTWGFLCSFLRQTLVAVGRTKIPSLPASPCHSPGFAHPPAGGQ